METLKQAIRTMHEKFGIPHVMITSVNLESTGLFPDHLCVVGSTMTSDRKARLFKIQFPAMDCYFSGTGDMFGALTVVRMREAVSKTPGLMGVSSWVSEDSVDALDLPLARAAEKAVGSMHQVLSKTLESMRAALKPAANAQIGDGPDANQSQLVRSKASELRLVRNLSCLQNPTQEFKAIRI